MDLSVREDEVVKTLIKNDLGIKQVANKLFISDRTAQKHIEKAKRKYNVKTLSGLAFAYLKDHRELLAIFLITLQIMSIGFKRINHRKRGKTNNIARVSMMKKTRSKNIYQFA